eukprot:gene12380-biopygen21475
MARACPVTPGVAAAAKQGVAGFPRSAVATCTQGCAHLVQEPDITVCRIWFAPVPAHPPAFWPSHCRSDAACARGDTARIGWCAGSTGLRHVGTPCENNAAMPCTPRAPCPYLKCGASVNVLVTTRTRASVLEVRERGEEARKHDMCFYTTTFLAPPPRIKIPAFFWPCGGRTFLRLFVFY